MLTTTLKRVEYLPGLIETDFVYLFLPLYRKKSVFCSFSITDKALKIENYWPINKNNEYFWEEKRADNFQSKANVGESF